MQKKKYRVYELVKEFKKSDKEVMDALKKNHIEVTSRLSGVDEGAKTVLAKEFEASKKPAKRPQMRTVRFDQQGRPTDRKSGEAGRKAAYSSVEPEAQKAPAAPKPAEVKEEAPKAEAAHQERKETRGREENTTRPVRDNRNDRPNNDRNDRRNDRSSGDRNDRPSGDRNNRSYGDRNSRPSGDRNGNRSYGDRNGRPSGDRNGNRPSGDRNGNRPYGDRNGNRPSGDRNGNRPYGDRNGRPAGDRNGRPAGDRNGRPFGGNDHSRNDHSHSQHPAAVAAPVEEIAPETPAVRREKPAKKKTKKDWEKARREKEGGSLMARSLNQGKKKKHNQEKKQDTYPTEVTVPAAVTVKELAELFGCEVSEIIKHLMALGVMATINQNLDPDTVEILAEEFGVTLLKPEKEEDPTEYIPEPDDPRFLVPRPPIVTIMGHVDHGKTTLLDALRQTNVALHEAGGITQRIGAYQIRYKGHKITFLDTPGHEAFTAMRSRGAQLTDIAVLIVAADDGVMPQTIEAIHHAKNAGVPIMVAINKIDKPGANPDRIKEELSKEGLLAEDWGGDVIMTPISAKKKIGLDDLLENILLVAEMKELKANPKREAYGVVVEAQLDKGRGPVMSVLVQNGTLHVGDGILAGKSWGRVRAMNNENGRKMKSAEPAAPVEILGMDSVPEAGDHFYVMDERKARNIAEIRASRAKEEEQRSVQKVTLDNIFEKIKEGEMKELDLIVKADVQGSVEALVQSLMGIKSDEVRVSIVHSAVGAINESDVMLASASNALIIGFNVRPDANARALAEKDGVDMRLYRVIYDCIDDIKAAMAGMLAPTIREVVLGHAEVRQVIHTPKLIVAGCYVQDGKITSSCRLRLIRDGIVIHEGKIASLRRFKDDVKEVAQGFECGISLESYRDVKEGDQLESFELKEEAATLE
ncbi:MULTISPECIES: translation initiation factor IF-2 [Dialister]|jgi:translation initiation factor IF-2|uniref:Translation initiation factor IF-2 n=1 Tax=Dialister hominis TaxID=2582419 RepID=A0A8D4UTH9_9FIRM|nr:MULTISPECIES: translation initiation factor IF-2 [Dialister]MBS6412553.1 translation initiation factor IF-2 [Dialister sp.]BBK24361.1 translation initiation factor IF-2 [Dialister hominis]